MQTLLTEATAAYSPTGMSDLFFIPELLMMAAEVDNGLTSRTPAGFASEYFEMGISTSPAPDDDLDEDENDDEEDDFDEDEDEDDEDEDDDDEDDEDLDDLDDDLDEEEA